MKNKLVLNRLSQKVKANDILLIKTPDFSGLESDNYASDIAYKCKCLVILAHTHMSDYSVQYIKLGSSVKLQYKSSL